MIFPMINMLTWMEDSRPGKSTLGMKVWIESDVQVENTRILHLDIKDRKTNLRALLLKYVTLLLGLFC